MEDGQGSRERRWYPYVTHHCQSLVVLVEQLALKRWFAFIIFPFLLSVIFI